MSTQPQQLIDAYEKGADDVSQAIRSLTREDLLCPPAADANVGRWSIQEVVLHLADCDAVFADRMKRVIAEDNPQLVGFDETKWAAALKYDQQSAEVAAQMFELNRKQMAAILRSLAPAAFDRAGTHTERGRQTLTDILTYAVNHLAHHIKFIHAKRANMGKEMW